MEGGFKGAGDTAQGEGKRPGPWLWHRRVAVVMAVALPLARATAVCQPA